MEALYTAFDQCVIYHIHFMYIASQVNALFNHVLVNEQVNMLSFKLTGDSILSVCTCAI